MKIFAVCFAIAVAAVAGSASAQQPFQNIQQSPTVSPYLNLLNRSNSGLPSYQTLVRPALDQQATNQQQQQQLSKLQHGQKSLLAADKGASSRGISNEIRGTGHVTARMDYLHYFPQQTRGPTQ